MTRNNFFCPTSKVALSVADKSLLQAFIHGVETNTLINRGGHKITNKPDAILINSEAQIAYPVQNGIPQLLPQLAVSLALLNQGNSVE